jgi:hypothetical protein
MKTTHFIITILIVQAAQMGAAHAQTGFRMQVTPSLLVTTIPNSDGTYSLGFEPKSFGETSGGASGGMALEEMFRHRGLWSNTTKAVLDQLQVALHEEELLLEKESAEVQRKSDEGCNIVKNPKKFLNSTSSDVYKVCGFRNEKTVALTGAAVWLSGVGVQYAHLLVGGATVAPAVPYVLVIGGTIWVGGKAVKAVLNYATHYDRKKRIRELRAKVWNLQMELSQGPAASGT